MARKKSGKTGSEADGENATYATAHRRRSGESPKARKGTTLARFHPSLAVERFTDRRCGKTHATTVGRQSAIPQNRENRHARLHSTSQFRGSGAFQFTHKQRLLFLEAAGFGFQE